MAEQRKHTASMLLRAGSETGPRVDLYPAEQWPDAGGRAGLYRVRVNRRWFSRDGEKYTFLTLEGVGRIIGSLLGKTLGIDIAIEEPAPTLFVGESVRVPNGNYLDGEPLYDRTRVTTPPMRGHDGRWYVFVTLYGRGRVAVPCSDIRSAE